MSKDATTAEIRKAYRAAALRWHPDKNADRREEAERKFVAIAAAYEVLSDDNSRAAYDRGGDALVPAPLPPEIVRRVRTVEALLVELSRLC